MTKNKQKQGKSAKKLPSIKQADQFLLARVGRQKLKEDYGRPAQQIFERLFDIVAARDAGHALQALRFINDWCGPKTGTGIKQKAQATAAIVQPKPEREQTEEELEAEIAELDAEIKELQSAIGSVAAEKT